MPSTCGNARNGGAGNIREKNFKKSCWWRGGSPLLHPWDGKRQGVGLTAEGTSGQRHRRDPRGVGSAPGLGQEGAPARAGRQAARPRGRRGAGMLPGGSGTAPARWSGTRRVPGRRQRGRQPGTCLETTRPERGTARAFTISGPTGALQGRCRAGAVRAEQGKGRGAERGLRPGPRVPRPAF